MIARVVAVAAGIWLMFAPSLLGYRDPAAANDRIFGPIGAALAFVAIWEVLRPLRWGALLVGLWLLGAPFALGYADSAAVVSSLAAGALMAGSAPFGGATRQIYGGGWRTLLHRGRRGRGLERPEPPD